MDVLAESKTFDAVRHLTGILQVKYPDWKDPNGSTHQIVLFGYKDEAMQKYLPKQETMGFDVKRELCMSERWLQRILNRGNHL